MDSEGFTSQDEGLVPVELEGSYYHKACAEAMGILGQVWAWHGSEKYATYAMDINPAKDEHEFCCSACGELFPFINTGRWS